MNTKNKIKSEIRQITPKVAKEMLAKNRSNRPLFQPHISFLAKEMLNGNWQFDGSPIRSRSDGTLLDGQHRLSAIIEADTPQELLVLTGISTEAFSVMDTGRSRSGSDVLNLEGAEYYCEIASAIRRLLVANNTGDATGRGGGGTFKPSNSDILKFYRDHSSLNQYAVFAQKYYAASTKLISKSDIIFYLYLFSEKSITDAELFLSKVCTGLNLEADSPIYLLRKKLLEDRMSDMKMTRKLRHNYFLVSWNKFRKQESVSKLLVNTKSVPEII